MKILTLLRALAIAATPAVALAPTAGLGANADAPYRNVDRSNDQGNETGDSRVEGLNGGQLNENYSGPQQLRTPTNPPMAQTPPAYAPR